MWAISEWFFQAINPPTEQYFLKVWKEKVPWLKCRSYHKFMMCDECISINDRMRTAKTGGEASASSPQLILGQFELLGTSCFPFCGFWLSENEALGGKEAAPLSGQGRAF